MRVRFAVNSGTPISVGAVTVTPRSQAMLVTSPFGNFVWNRPTEVLSARAGRTERIRIVDVTRLAQLGFFALGVLIATVVLVGSARRGRREPGEDSGSE